MIYSHTFFNDWENCNHKAARKHILKDLPRETATQKMSWGIDVHKAFERRINQNRPFDQELGKYEQFVNFGPYRARAEQKLGVDADGMPCDFFAGNVKVRGVVDIELTHPDVDHTAVLMDLKTGKVYEDPEELELHAMLLNAHHPKLQNIYGHYLWLQDGRVGKRHNLSQTAWKWNQTCERIDSIEHSIKMESFPKSQNPLCDWCPVKDCAFNGKGRNR